MSILEEYFNTEEASSPLEDETAASLAAALGGVIDARVYLQSSVFVDGRWVCLARNDQGKHAIIAQRESDSLDLPVKPLACKSGVVAGEGVKAAVCEMTPELAAQLREWLPFANPQTLGTKLSFGAGDRLGLAGPGHIRAARLHGGGIGLVIAQQSARELTRTERTNQQVMDAATWAVIQEGYREPWGADADHLKTFEDVDSAAEAGFTMFTIDPGDHVDDHADKDDTPDLMIKYDALPWDALETDSDAMWHKYVGITYELGDGVNLVSETPDDLMRAACKYGKAIAHSVAMARHIAEVMGDRPFEIEVSVDETASPTRVFEHFFVATELNRLGVPNLVSLAPRFIGAFEKGVDYHGDLSELDEAMRRHAVIARYCGPYKLSIHSGSDKFSVYPVAAKHAGELVHVKTAGTSYLEALRVIGDVAPELFREVYAFSYGRFEQDRATYHVSAELEKVPKPADLSDDRMAGLLDQDDPRQVFHVAFGSVLTARNDDGSTRFRDRILAALDANEEAHYDALVRHIGRHMSPFVTS